MTRRYEKRQRAVRETETRRRIVDATIGLHEAIGGPATTVTEIARVAGVSRLTVYRHFPDERSLLVACTGTYLAKNPPPDPVAWSTIADPVARLQVALSELYPFYRRNQGVLARADQEMPTNPVLAEVLSGYTAAVAAMAEGLSGYTAAVAAMAEALSAGWPAVDDLVLRAAVGHAVAFGTWGSLTAHEGLTDAHAVRLMGSMVAAAAT